MSGFLRRGNIAAGNFFFKYRNGLFPITFLIFLAVMRPAIFGGDERLDRFLRTAGLFVVLGGELIRLATIGFEYIERGGKGGKVYASRLVQKGVYGLTRNPMYAGNFLIAVGLVLFSGVPAAYVTVIPFFLFVYQAIIAAESEFLRKTFGAEYDAYCARVPWFFPSFRGFREAFAGTRFNWRRSIRQDLSTFTWVALVLAALPLWRSSFLHGWASARLHLGRTLAVESAVLAFYGGMVLLKQRHSPWLYKETPAGFLIAGLVAAGAWLAGPAALAQETATQSVPETPAVTYRFGQFKIDGSGDLSGDSQELNVRAQMRNLFRTPAFLSAQGRVAQEQFRHYDLHRWGAEFEAGWALDPKTDLTAGYRREAVSVFHISPDADRAYRSVSGLNGIAAAGLALNYDGRDDRIITTRGRRFKIRGELALHGLGSDAEFGRIDSDWAGYLTPWRDLTLVEHLRLGWAENFGRTEDVPFFERYFVGGSNTVRGHRGRWLSPRGVDDQFVGGEIQLFNNMEARWPLFKERFRRRLSTAVFFDAGRAFRRFSDIGDFGFGAGAGLRYVVDGWQIQGVLRVDYGFNLNPEDDDSRANLHITFGMPF